MTELSLDLTAQRCPMSLLLMKREVAKLSADQRLTIIVSDPASLRDMLRYLGQHPYSFRVEQQHPLSLLIVERLPAHV